ncbi:MAG: prepilin-type N-terminal cleavage/methylation domain-containing protein [bacterium]|nr:prepilin-type N-terminal cleavage/methylation domain-containing protein [bacterium]
MRKSKGFTLIELMVVVGIIGLLSSVILVAVTSGRSRARDGRRKADIKQLQAAVELYFNANNTYPTNSSPQCADDEAGALGVITPTFLPALPRTQPGIACILYRGTAIDYKLSTPLENPDTDALNTGDGGTDDNRFEVFTGVGRTLF